MGEWFLLLSYVCPLLLSIHAPAILFNAIIVLIPSSSPFPLPPLPPPLVNTSPKACVLDSFHILFVTFFLFVMCDSFVYMTRSPNWIWHFRYCSCQFQKHFVFSHRFDFHSPLNSFHLHVWRRKKTIETCCTSLAMSFSFLIISWVYFHISHQTNAFSVQQSKSHYYTGNFTFIVICPLSA